LVCDEQAVAASAVRDEHLDDETDGENDEADPSAVVELLRAETAMHA
jgi:hypothetical protein